MKMCSDLECACLSGASRRVDIDVVADADVHAMGLLLCHPWSPVATAHFSGCRDTGVAMDADPRESQPVKLGTHALLSGGARPVRTGSLPPSTRLRGRSRPSKQAGSQRVPCLLSI